MGNQGQTICWRRSCNMTESCRRAAKNGSWWDCFLDCKNKLWISNFLAKVGKKVLKVLRKMETWTSTIPQQLTEQTPSAEEDDWKLRNSYSTDLVLTSVLWRYVVQSHDPRNLGATGNLKTMNLRFWNHETSENLKHLISDKRFSKKNMSIQKKKQKTAVLIFQQKISSYL